MNEQVYNEFVREFTKKVNNVKKQYSNYIFVCIGTEKIVGDSFGPMVGGNLKHLSFDNNMKIEVIGSKENIINYNNIDKKLKEVSRKYQNSCTVLIDSALSKKENIGKIVVTNKNMQIGSALNKNKYINADISVKAVVGQNYKLPKYNFRVLKNVSSDLVMNLANTVSYGIYEVVNTLI